MFGKLLKRPLSRYCSTLTAAHSLQHTHCSTPTAAHSLQHTHCSTPTAAHPLQHTHCSTPTAAHCNTLQYAKLWEFNTLRTLQRATTYPSRNPNRNTQSTGWWRFMGCLTWQVIFRKRATNYRALLRKITYKDTACYGSLPLCTTVCDLLDWRQISVTLYTPRNVLRIVWCSVVCTDWTDVRFPLLSTRLDMCCV